MKRQNLFRPTQERVDHRPWRQAVATAVREKSAQQLLALFRQSHAMRNMHAGFLVDNADHNSFASFCLSEPNGIWALGQVARNVPGFTLAECCHHEITSGGLTVSSDIVLHEEALRIQRPNAAALALALELEPNHVSLTEPRDRFMGASLHCEAVNMLTGGLSEKPKLEVAACCKLLLAHGAPVVHLNPPHKGRVAADHLFGTGWDKHPGAEVVLQVARHYVSERAIDLFAPTSARGLRPAELAIHCGNGMAAALAIDMGCDISCDPNLGAPDLISLANLMASSNMTSGTTVALVTAAVMRRRLQGAHAVGGNQQSVPAAARRGRMGL